AYVAMLAAKMGEAPKGSVYAMISGIIDRYATSLLDSGPLVLPIHEDAPDVRGYVDDAVAAHVLERYDAFLAETERYTSDFLGRDAGAAFRSQRLLAPRPGQNEPIEADFDHDWPAWLAASGEARLALRPTRVEYRPPLYAMFTDFRQFSV